MDNDTYMELLRLLKTWQADAYKIRASPIPTTMTYAQGRADGHNDCIRALAESFDDFDQWLARHIERFPTGGLRPGE